MKMTKKAEAYIDTVVTVFLSVLILYICTSMFYALVNYQRMDSATEQIINVAAINGEVNSPGFQDKCLQIMKKNKLDPADVKISFEKSEKIPGVPAEYPIEMVQIGKNIAMTMEQGFGLKYLGKDGASMFTISVTKNKLSERFWDLRGVGAWIKIPVGGAYYKQDGTMLSEGDYFPYAPAEGDTYFFDGYQYKYNMSMGSDGNMWDSHPSQKGWGVGSTFKNKTTYPAILEYIGPNPVVSMANAFRTCTTMTEAPMIPKTIKDMRGAFVGANNINKPIVINATLDGADKAQDCFMSRFSPLTLVQGEFASDMTITYLLLSSEQHAVNCEGYLKTGESYITGGKTIPAYHKMPAKPSDTDVFVLNTYKYVYSASARGWAVQLNEAMVPDRTTVKYVMSILPSVNGIPVKNMDGTFKGCTSLISVPTIPESVISMKETFMNCSSLKAGPIIPKNVLFMDNTFNNCGAMGGDLTIHANPTTYAGCFQDAGTFSKPILLTGTSSKLSVLAGTGNSLRVKVK